jgi:hypothetical protein
MPDRNVQNLKKSVRVASVRFEELKRSGLQTVNPVRQASQKNSNPNRRLITLEELQRLVYGNTGSRMGSTSVMSGPTNTERNVMQSSTLTQLPKSRSM